MSASPPPLKRPPPVRPGPPPLRAQRDVLRDAIDSLEGEAVDDLDDPSVGEWLFKEDDVVKGPVAASVLTAKLKSGESSGTLLIAREIGQWKTIETFPYFKSVLAERQRTLAEARKKLEAQVAARKKILGRMFLIATLLLVPFGAAAFAGHAVVKARPWDQSADWLAKVPPVLKVKPKPVKRKKKKAPEPPPEVVADKTDGETTGDKVAMADKPTDKEPSKSKASSKRSKSKSKSGKSKKSTDSKNSKNSKTKASAATAGADKAKGDKVAKADANLPRTLSKKQIMGGLSKGKGGFGRCIKSALKNTPDDIPGKITIAFSVANDGKAVGVKLLERQVRGSALEKCIQKAMGKITWPKFYGERKYTQVPFNISKPKS